jgi:hypothetical protein
MEDVYPSELIGAMAALHAAHAHNMITVDQFIRLAACFMQRHGLYVDTVTIKSIIESASMASYCDGVAEVNKRQEPPSVIDMEQIDEGYSLKIGDYHK